MADTERKFVGAPRKRGEWTVIEFHGEIDFSRSRELRSTLEALARGPDARVVVHLGRVAYLDSTALATLVACRRQASETGGRIRLCSLPPRLKELIRITQLSKVFDTFETEDEAVA